MLARGAAAAQYRFKTMKFSVELGSGGGLVWFLEQQNMTFTLCYL